MMKSVVALLRSPLVRKLHMQGIPCGKQLGVVSVSSRFLHVTSSRSKDTAKEAMRRAPRREQGTEGETSIDIDTVNVRTDQFPDENTPDRLFDGVPFKEIPIINIKATKNNTLMTLTDHAGYTKIINTCGTEGFKTAKKGTNVAAQATAISLSRKALEKGYKTVRVRVGGIGPGRMAAVKGLQMGGMEIISLTDSTRVTWTPLRPRKARRV